MTDENVRKMAHAIRRWRTATNAGNKTEAYRALEEAKHLSSLIDTYGPEHLTARNLTQYQRLLPELTYG